MWLTTTHLCIDAFDINKLISKVLALPEESWHLDQDLLNQLTVNRPTHSIFIQSIDAQSFAKILSERPLQASDIQRKAGWDMLSADVTELVRSSIAHYSKGQEGGIVTRIQLARMSPGAKIDPHIDRSHMLIAAHRLHVPLTTNPEVVFVIDGKRISMEAGKLYELNNRVEHSVVNEGTDDRIHLIIDYLPPEHNKPEAITPRFEMLRKQREKDIAFPPPEPRLNYKLPKLITTSVIRGANQNESHGGIYLVDMQSEEYKQVVDWDTCDISWEGRGWDRGLRGIAIAGDHIFVAASDELFCFDAEFKILDSWKCPCLKHAHEICLDEHRLLVTSTGFDSLLSFNLETKEFDQAWLIRAFGNSQNTELKFAAYDPRQKGPPPGNSVHLNNVFSNEKGVFLSARGIPFVMKLMENGMDQGDIIPRGTHNAQPYNDGLIYNDTNADLLVYQSATDFCYMDVPRYADADLENTHFGDEKIARQAFGRGLCRYQDSILFAGSSPSTITAWDLKAGTKIKSVNLSMDIRNAIHGLEVWPENPGRL